MNKARLSAALIIRIRWVVLAAFAALCVWVVPGLTALQHDDDVLAFLPPEHPDVVAFGEVAERFGMLEVALVGLRADGEDLLTPVRTEEVRAVGRRVAELPGVRLVLSYPDLPDARVRGETLVVDPLVPTDVSEPEVIRTRVLANRNAVGNLVSEDGEAAALLVYLSDRGVSAQRTDQLAGIRQVVEAHWSGQAFFGGAPFIEDAAASASRRDIERLSPVVIGVLAVASALLLGSITGAALNLLVTGLGVALVVGAHGTFGEPFTIVSSTTPVMMVALGGAFGMHVISGYQRQQGTSAQRASAALRELWLPVVLSGATTATAFFALLVMPQAPMQRFGVVAGLGVLLLLVLALAVLPPLLSLLPAGWLRYRPPRSLPLRFVPPLWLLLVMALAGGFLGGRLQADPDTRNMFDASSEPARADRFFGDAFGGSQFVQIAIEGDLAEPVVLRAIRRVSEDVAAIDGVADVRSLVEPVRMLTEGFGGRDGLPETAAQGRRVITNLADQPPMAQLMTPDGAGAIVHVKLGPLSSERMFEVVAQVREVVAAAPVDTIAVGDARTPEVAAIRRAEVEARLARLARRDLHSGELDAALDVTGRGRGLLDEVEALRDRAFGTDELVEPVEREAYEAIDPSALVQHRGAELEALIRERLPVLVDSDPEGIEVAAEQLGRWIDDAIERHRMDTLCETLELVEPGACREAASIISELSDLTWAIPPQAKIPAVRELPFTIRITGQPIMGEAFASSVRRSLWVSTLVSLGALTLVLALSGHLLALVPALWTLAMTASVVGLLGHPISVASSMVSCIVLGAGVDFAIHIGVRARAVGGDAPGQQASHQLGAVVLATGVELALAFGVLVASEMPTLRQFGMGLAIGLPMAALGAVWFAPKLYRRTR